MDQASFENNRTLRYRIPLTILSLIAAIFYGLSCIRCFYYYVLDSVFYPGIYQMIFVFPERHQLLPFLIGIAPYILLILYILKFYKTSKARIFVSIIFGLIAASYLYNITSSLISNAIFRSRLGLGVSLADILVGFLLFVLPLVVPFVLATINASKKSPKKVFFIIAIVVGFVIQLLGIFFIFQYRELYAAWGWNLDLFVMAVEVLGAIVFYTALLLLLVFNKSFHVTISVSPEKEKEKLEKMPPEQALRYLKDKLERGTISEEEYQEQRAEIIRKL